MIAQLRRVFGFTLALLVLGTAIATTTRHYMYISTMVDPSSDWAIVGAVMVGGSLILALLYPDNPASRNSFIILTFTAMLSAAIDDAPELGLIDVAPIQWRWAISLARFSPIGCALWMGWSRLVIVKAGDSGSGSDTDSAQKTALPPKKRGGWGSFTNRIRARKSKVIPRQKSDSDSGIDTGSGSDTAALYQILETLATIGSNGGEGSVSAAATRLNISRGWVNQQLQELYKIDPKSVIQRVPNWAKRNLGIEVEAS